MQNYGLLVGQWLRKAPMFIPNEAESAHAHWLQIGVPGLSVNKPEMVETGLLRRYLLVISNVVPKIWARTNSAMFARVYSVLVVVEKMVVALASSRWGLGSTGALLRGARSCALQGKDDSQRETQR